MKWLRLVFAVLLAIALVVCGGNFFLEFFELPPGDGPAGPALLQAMHDGGLMGAIAGSHVLVGVGLLIPRTWFVSGLLQLPITIGIARFHAPMLPTGLVVTLVMLALNLGVIAEPARLRALVAPPMKA